MTENTIVETLTPEQAAQILRDIGIKTSAMKIRAGISQGVYPFGECVQMVQNECTIYKKLLEQWISERAG